MDIGRTNKRITFCRYAEKQNELLQTETVLEEIKTVWASVEPTRGREYQEAQRIRPELTYKITTRYHKEVTPDMFIKFKDRYFQIVSIINVRERNEMLEIVCTEKLTENPAIEKITLNAKKSYQLKPVINPITCTYKAIYKTSNKKIVKVTSRGKITAVKKGKAKITVMVGKKKFVCTVTIK